MSRKIPPEGRRYEMGGGAGSRLMIWIRLGLPISPLATACRTRMKFESKRRLNPTCSCTPALSTAASELSIFSRLSDTGFSQKMCLPACAAFTIRSACVSVEVQISTASILLSAKISSADAATVGMLQRAGNRLRGLAIHVGDRHESPLQASERQASPHARGQFVPHQEFQNEVSCRS